MELWQVILITIGGNAVLLGALAFLARALLSQLFAKDLARFQIELKASSDKSATELEHRLGLLAHEHQVRFSELHVRRAAALDEIYQRVIALEEATSVLAIPAREPVLQEPEFRAAEAEFRLLQKVVKRHRIYLPSTSCEALNKLLHTVLSMLANYSISLLSERIEGLGLPNTLEAGAQKAWQQVNQYLELEAPKLLAQIEEDFRAALGGSQIAG